MPNKVYGTMKGRTIVISWSDTRCSDCGRFIRASGFKKRCHSCYKKAEHKQQMMTMAKRLISDLEILEKYLND